jgi:TetR/AcrR family transcriptional repressor of nem operon
MSAGSKEEILAAAKRAAMAHGYNGLNFRDIAGEVGIKAPSIYHHFPTKADLGAAVAKRYWEDIVVDLNAISDASADPLKALRRYPEIFRKSLLNDNRMCLCSFMAAEYDDLPDAVKKEVQSFADVNVTWLSKLLAGSCDLFCRRGRPAFRQRSLGYLNLRRDDRHLSFGWAFAGVIDDLIRLHSGAKIKNYEPKSER